MTQVIYTAPLLAIRSLYRTGSPIQESSNGKKTLDDVIKARKALVKELDDYDKDKSKLDTRINKVMMEVRHDQEGPGGRLQGDR